MKNITLNESIKIEDYKLILEALVEDFGYVFYGTILRWCEVISGKNEDKKFWRVLIVQYDYKTIGICGLYSLKEKDTTELWLGWFGIIKEHRNKGIGKIVLDMLECNAKLVGCKNLYTYVDKNGKPLPFYYKNNFTNIGLVKEYLITANNSIEDFEDENDFVLRKQL